MSDAYPNLGFDPCPGDLSAAESVARTMHDVASLSSSTHTTLTAINTSSGIWVGRAADAFSETFDEVPPYLQRAVNALDAAARALQHWVYDLDRFQQTARRLEEEAAAAQQQVDSAQSAVDALPSDTSEMDDDELSEHEDDERARGSALDNANAALNEVIRRAEQLRREYEEAAEDTSRALSAAADDAPPEPGLFESIGNAVADIVDFLTDPNTWKLIGDIFADIAAVVGVICLAVAVIGLFVASGGTAALILGAIGTIGGYIGLGAGAAGLLFHGMAMAGGAEGVTWETIGFDLITVATGGLGVMGAGIAGAARGATGLAGLGTGMFSAFRGGGAGWALVGEGMGWAGNILGNAGSAESQRRRMNDDGTTFSDIPIIGPISDLGDLAGEHMAPDATFVPPVGDSGPVPMPEVDPPGNPVPMPEVTPPGDPVPMPEVVPAALTPDAVLTGTDSAFLGGLEVAA
ncbi:hypothetical protein SAMN06297387_12385 [Streptomyces zhaozhouensis]|uniref:Putative T7SS secretion signal domain-containing protein n=1 Tax=Streptomyces zhaozhouensis TaxID=1300267 RepID=A0A286E4N3_9ACTN|nr:WXG100 family type VII secretion target [Streptomyces zhaozhouensis]SOD65856.1 hypothetical protein SAMN06297387_12385 [Streptomyces zhaozhouensis]